MGTVGVAAKASDGSVSTFGIYETITMLTSILSRLRFYFDPNINAFTAGIDPGETGVVNCTMLVPTAPNFATFRQERRVGVQHRKEVPKICDLSRQDLINSMTAVMEGYCVSTLIDHKVSRAYHHHFFQSGDISVSTAWIAFFSRVPRSS